MPEVTTIKLDLNYPRGYSQRELDAYRKIGTLTRLTQLKQREIRRRRRCRIIKKAVALILMASVYTIGAWMLLSFLDIVIHNLDPNPVYQSWNFFIRYI